MDLFPRKRPDLFPALLCTGLLNFLAVVDRPTQTISDLTIKLAKVIFSTREANFLKAGQEQEIHWLREKANQGFLSMVGQQEAREEGGLYPLSVAS